MKNKWRNYALKDGKVQSSYIREYCNRSPKRQASKASRRHSVLESRQEQSKKEIELVYKKPDNFQLKAHPSILTDSWVINLRKDDESIGKENPPETHQEGRQGIQISDQGRCEAKEGNSEIKTPEKEVDANDRINGERRSDQKAERGQDTQSSSGSKCLMDV